MTEEVKDGWRKMKLKEVFTIKHGFAFKGEYFVNQGEYLLLTPGNFKEGGGLKYKGEKEKYYVGDFPEEYLLKKSDLLIVMTDLKQDAPILGSAAFIPQSNKYLHNQRLGKIKILNPSEIDLKFLFFLLNSSRIRDQIKGSASGATVKHTSPDRIYNVIATVPSSLAVQRKIAAILSAYDDLIENNTRRIKILEEMAQIIYREWFVKFRFPGYEKVKMVDSELGRIPEEWEVKKVKDIVKRLKAGKTYTQKGVMATGSVPVIDQSRSEFLGFHNNESDHYTSSEEPIIIFGDHTCKMQIMVEPFSLGPNVIPFISNDNGLIYYLFFLIHNLVETREYKRHWNELVIKKVALADKKSQIFFSEMVKPITEEIDLLRKRNLTLRRTCDILLPKLISEEIDVDDLDINTEELEQ